LRSNRKKVKAISPLHLRYVNEAQICLIHEGRSLQGMADPFSTHLAMRDLLKFPVHQRHQRFERFGVATSPGLQQPGYLGTIWLHSS
jgi:hypothetical protein